MKIFLPASSRTEKNDGRPEIIAKQEWLKEFQGLNFDFGFEIRGNLENFNPAILDGLPYGIHLSESFLNQFKIAKLADNKKLINDFWQTIKKWVRLNPGPEYVVFHGAELNKIPPIDNQRFKYPVKPKEMLKLAIWHQDLFKRIKKEGLPSPSLENINVFKYYNGLPITHAMGRFGVYRDLVNFKAETGCEAVIDFEHLQTTVQSLNSETVELQEIEKSQFARVNSSPQFLKHFGFLAEKGKIPRAHPDFPVTWKNLISQIRPRICHITGISAGQVIKLNSNQGNTSYHRELCRLFGKNIEKFTKNRRRGEHAPLTRNDHLFRKMLKQVLSVTEYPDELTLVLEVQGSGELSPDTHYWSQPDALQSSLRELIFILQEVKT